MHRAVVFTGHAVLRMAQRQLSTSEVRLVLEHGQAIETYPHDTPYPRRRVLGFAGGRPIHVVAADPRGRTRRS
ncbi:MAG: DUF4258 domain-containing protein [Candidatus Schekmanbacteria bacterium]|nr:DUF4258 domain-containing protein [Candidatus Schekmanbacteria bacterium]